MDIISGYAALWKKTGDEDAFGLVLSECEPLISRLSYWMSSDRLDAAQDLRVVVLEALRDWDGQRAFMPFAATVLWRNAVILLQRQQRRNRIETVSLDADANEGDGMIWHDVVPDPKKMPVDAGAEQRDDVEKAMRILHSHKAPMNKKTSFLLTAIRGHSYLAAAKVQKCNVKKVDNNIQEIRRKIRGTDED